MLYSVPNHTRLLEGLRGCTGCRHQALSSLACIVGLIGCCGCLAAWAVWAGAGTSTGTAPDGTQRLGKQWNRAKRRVGREPRAGRAAGTQCSCGRREHGPPSGPAETGVHSVHISYNMKCPAGDDQVGKRKFAQHTRSPLARQQLGRFLPEPVSV